MTSQFSVNGTVLNTSAPVASSTLNGGPGEIMDQPGDYRWRDAVWLERRRHDRPDVSPVSIYRIFPSAWRVDDQGRPLTWSALARQLVPYAADLGFTHIELLGFTPGDATGHKPTRPTESERFENTCAVTDQAFAEFVDQCHEGGLGVILDWPALGDEMNGAESLGKALPLIADYLDAFHLDGLRLELDPRTEAAHQHAGNPWATLVQSLQELVRTLAERFPSLILLLENRLLELGLDLPASSRLLTWNTLWCDNILTYLREDPDTRSWRHESLMDGLNRASDKNYVLPLADGKSSQGLSSWLERMPGDQWQRFANLRACLGFMCAHPGKKLLGMGTEFAQGRGWRYDARLDWDLFSDPCNSGVFRLVADLNRLYVTEPALHLRDWAPEGFNWVVGDDTENSVVAFLRHGDEGMAPLLAVVNFKPVIHHDYRVGVPGMGVWRELINTDSKFYGGSNVGNASGVQAESIPSHGYPASLSLTIPPLATLLLRQGDWPT